MYFKKSDNFKCCQGGEGPYTDDGSVIGSATLGNNLVLSYKVDRHALQNPAISLQV